jgi:hypothetical protein
LAHAQRRGRGCQRFRERRRERRQVCCVERRGVAARANASARARASPCWARHRRRASQPAAARSWRRCMCAGADSAAVWAKEPHLPRSASSGATTKPAASLQYLLQPRAVCA